MFNPRWKEVPLFPLETVFEYVKQGFIPVSDGKRYFYSSEKVAAVLARNDAVQFLAHLKNEGLDYTRYNIADAIKDVAERDRTTHKRVLLDVWKRFVPKVTDKNKNDWETRLLVSYNYWNKIK